MVGGIIRIGKLVERYVKKGGSSLYRILIRKAISMPICQTLNNP